MKRFGLDCEECKNYGKKGSLRLIQIYDPHWTDAPMGRTTVLFRPKGKVDWQVIYVDIATEKITRTGRTIPLAKVQAFLGNPEHEYVTHSGHYDIYTSLRDVGVIPKSGGDSYILAALKPSGPQHSKSLNNQMKKHVDAEYEKHKWGKWEDFEWDAEEVSDGAVLYGAFDAYAGYVLEKTQKEQNPRYAGFVYQLELDLIAPLAQMRNDGVVVIEAGFQKALHDYKVWADQKSMELWKLRGGPVRVGSNAELSQWLFGERGNKPVIMTDSGKPSCSEEALELIDDPVVEQIKEMKHIQSVLSSLSVIQKENQGEIVGQDRIFHPEFKPLSESSGSRIYTQDPSINQWPWALREQVVPNGYREGEVFYFADISAFELMMVAYAAGEDELIQTYMSGRDIHCKVAKDMFGGDEANISEDVRETTKVVEYATLYGSEGHSVSRKLNIPLPQAKSLMDRYMAALPRASKLRSEVHSKAMKAGLVTTPYGRYKRLSEAFYTTKGAQESAKRKAWSFFAQSGSADIMKRGLIHLYRNLPQGCRLTFTVFDSVLIRMPNESFRDQVDQVMKEAMSPVINGRVWRFLFKSGTGVNWLAAKKAANKLII